MKVTYSLREGQEHGETKKSTTKVNESISQGERVEDVGLDVLTESHESNDCEHKRDQP